MRFRPLHPWNIAYDEAVAVQRQLRALLRDDVPLDVRRLRTVAGADVAYEPRRRPRHGRPDDEPAARFVAAVVVMRLPSLEIIETAVAAAETCFPYIPGLLSFREGPALERAFEQLTVQPDAILFDGQGMAHPRGLGLASHIGLLLDATTVGCAKSRLYGITRGEPGPRRGNRRALLAPADPHGAFAPGQRIGTVLRTRDNVKPVWVSVGHRIDLAGAERLVLLTTRGRRLCEPIRAAHHLVNDALRRSISGTPRTD